MNSFKKYLKSKYAYLVSQIDFPVPKFTCVVTVFTIIVNISFPLVSFTGEDMLKLIQTKSIRMNLFHVVVDGLPESGKSSLCRKMNVATESQIPSGKNAASVLDLYEAFLSHKTLEERSHNEWINFSQLRGKDGPPLDLLSFGLLYFLLGQHHVPKGDSDLDVDSSLFRSDDVREYFVSMSKSWSRCLSNSRRTK